jgi:hypothetical protein
MALYPAANATAGLQAPLPQLGKFCRMVSTEFRRRRRYEKVRMLGPLIRRTQNINRRFFSEKNNKWWVFGGGVWAPPPLVETEKAMERQQETQSAAFPTHSDAVLRHLADRLPHVATELRRAARSGKASDPIKAEIIAARLEKISRGIWDRSYQYYDRDFGRA